MADVETVRDFNPATPRRGNPFNRLFATAAPLIIGLAGSTTAPACRRSSSPRSGSFVVRNFFADLKRHDLGPNFHERNYDGTFQQQFMTEPLWGVGTTAPYGHDGRSPRLEEVILRHGGEAQARATPSPRCPGRRRTCVLDFLQSLVLFPPDDTASNLQANQPDRGRTSRRTATARSRSRRCSTTRPICE